jgi:hypothetical protein
VERHIVTTTTRHRPDTVASQPASAASHVWGKFQNTSRLEENPLLLRLKELESIERLVEKVGRIIDLHAGEGAGLDALLTRLVRLKGAEADSERA